MYNIILWGTGVIYNTHLNVLKLYEKTGGIHVVGITSSDLKGYNTLDGYKVYKPELLDTLDYDYLMIMNKRNFLDIVSKATELGVLKEKIISYEVLEIPNMNFEEYFNIKSKRISIISNNCWGGIVYKKLGLECLSPFKNLFLEDEDYIKLLSDFKSYMQFPLEFDHFCFDVHSNEKYPVMRLKDIFVHCNHDKDIEVAKRNWEHRKAKINYDYLFVEMYTENEEVAKQFCSLDVYENKLCFVPFEMDENCTIRLELEENQKEFWEAVNSCPTRGISYNLLDLLNMKNILRMK